MGGGVSVRARATATAQGNASATARASATAQGGSASARASATVTSSTMTFTPSKMRTTFTPSKIRTTFTPAQSTTGYLEASAYLADPARPRSNKIYLLKKLLKGDVHGQRAALIHLAKRKWINYLKRHDNKLVRFIEKFAAAKLSVEQSRHVSEQEKELWLKNQERAQHIWKQVGNEVLVRRMRLHIGNRCDIFESRLKKLEKGELVRLYKSVTSFRPPSECRMLRR